MDVLANQLTNALSGYEPLRGTWYTGGYALASEFSHDLSDDCDAFLVAVQMMPTSAQGGEIMFPNAGINVRFLSSVSNPALFPRLSDKIVIRFDNSANGDKPSFMLRIIELKKCKGFTEYIAYSRNIAQLVP